MKASISQKAFANRKEKRNILNRRSSAETVVFAILGAVLVIYCLTMTYPFVWMFLNSLKGPIEYASTGTFSLPQNWLFSNFGKAFKQLSLDNGTTFFGMIFNSVWYTVLSTVTSVFFSAITGYCMSKYDFRLKKYIYAIAIFALTIPIVGSAAAHLKLVKGLSLYDSPIYVIVSSMHSWGFNFLVLYAFFSNVSWSYAEATFVDGGDDYVVFFRIMLPQAFGPIVTLAIMASIGNWNDYMTMLMYLPSWPTIASGLYSFQANAIRGVNYPVYFSGLLLSIIPILVLFTFASDIIMTNLSTGGLKG